MVLLINVLCCLQYPLTLFDMVLHYFTSYSYEEDRKPHFG